MDASFNAAMEYWTRFTPSVTGLWEDQRSRERAQGELGCWGHGSTVGSLGQHYLPRNIQVFQYFDNLYDSTHLYQLDFSPTSSTIVCETASIML